MVAHSGSASCLHTTMEMKTETGDAASIQNQLEATVSSIDKIIFQLNDACHDAVAPEAAASVDKRILSSSSSLPIHHKEAPPGLEKQFQELHSLLHPFLVKRQRKSNVASLIMGLRGSGKTLLLERCLAKFKREAPEQSVFRIVRLNGLVIRGDDVGFAVKEIVRQLSDMAMVETRNVPTATGIDAATNINKNSESTDEKQEQKETEDNTKQDEERVRKKARKDQLDMEKLLRLRNSSFTSNLALLDEALKTACVDSIPILIVLDELDAFLGSSASDLEGRMASESASKTDRQLLLYHLLDRVATQGSFISLVGITSHLAAVGMFEKRVKSRAEGTSKVIYVKSHSTFTALVQILVSKFDVNKNGASAAQIDEVAKLRQYVTKLLEPPNRIGNDDIMNNGTSKVRDIMERNWKVGKDVRFFCRVFSCALSLYLEDCNTLLRKMKRSTAKDTQVGILPKLNCDHFLQALAVMGASSTNVVDLVVNPRVQALLDLSGPQLAVLLSARRILARDGQQEETPKPLTMERILYEYQTYQGNSNRYGDRLMNVSFVDLLEMDVIRPSADHTGGGPLQYDYNQSYYAMDTATMSRMPLHVPVDIDRELGEALRDNKLDCSTALRDWGRKIN